MLHTKQYREAVDHLKRNGITVVSGERTGCVLAWLSAPLTTTSLRQKGA